MTTKISCPSCGYSKELPQNVIPVKPTKVTCPQCRNIFIFQPIQKDQDFIIDAGKPDTGSESLSDLKHCPFCNNKIKQEAIKCKYCKNDIPNNDAITHNSTELFKNCPMCKEKIQSQATKCKHCGELLTSDIKHDQFIDNSSPSTLHKKIENLDIKSELKEVFKLFAITKIKKRTLGVPIFDTSNEKLLHTKAIGINNKYTIHSNLALFFGCFYYFYHGMWKKGISLIILSVTFGILFEVFIGGEFGKSICQLSVLATAAICFMSFKYDLYRHLVLNERSWW